MRDLVLPAGPAVSGRHGCQEEFSGREFAAGPAGPADAGYLGPIEFEEMHHGE
ncbi:hypothetical protein [Streptomyces sp. NPDC050485]|uniref:hypothetical protein n=1 Tax=Streptomyces sp. NPDC050485 TaxID=3365617 RepID=UPI0037AE8BAE